MFTVKRKDTMSKWRTGWMKTDVQSKVTKVVQSTLNLQPEGRYCICMATSTHTRTLGNEITGDNAGIVSNCSFQ